MLYPFHHCVCYELHCRAVGLVKTKRTLISELFYSFALGFRPSHCQSVWQRHLSMTISLTMGRTPEGGPRERPPMRRGKSLNYYITSRSPRCPRTVGTPTFRVPCRWRSVRSSRTCCRAYLLDRLFASKRLYPFPSSAGVRDTRLATERWRTGVG